VVNDRPTRQEAAAALATVLAELPYEFSAGPPGGHTRPEFRVIKRSNVERVHAGLWALQRYFEAATEPESETTAFVLTEWRQFVSVHRTREGAEAAQAALVEKTKAEWASSGWELLESAADEGPDTDVVQVEVRN